MPRGFKPAGDTGRGADDLLTTGTRADAGEQRIPGLPDWRDKLIAPVLQHLVIDPVGSAAQRQFAQGDQVALAEKVADRPFRLVGKINLAGLQALQQFVRRQVDQHHLVGRIELLVGHCFPDAYAGNAADHIVETLQVLDIDCGIHVNARRQQFVDVLPAFGVARAGHI